MSKYNTEQKRKINELFLSSDDRSLTSDEIVALLPDVGKSTVYRILSEMEAEGILSSYQCRSKKRFYRCHEDCSSHMHMFCTECGKLLHISEETADRIRKIVSDELGYEPDHIDFEIFAKCREHKEGGVK